MVDTKDRYVGRLYSDIGKVPSDSGIFWSTGELREYGEEVLGLMDQVVEERRQDALPPSPNRIGLGGRPTKVWCAPHTISHVIWGGGAPPPGLGGIRLACSLPMLPSLLPLHSTTVFFPFLFLI